MKQISRLIAAAVAGVLLAALTACASLDVVANDSVRALGDVLDALPAEGSAADGWIVTAPDGSAALEIENDSILMRVDAAPFTDAGLNPDELDSAKDGSLVFITPGFDMLNQNVRETPKEQFGAAVMALRGSLGYHAELDHYNLSFGDGNMFEWAKDMQKLGSKNEPQDKDIVFVLNPAPLIGAGVDPENVEGWVYGQVTVEMDGKMEQVWKFLKPFDLK